MKSLIIIDVPNLAHRNFYALSESNMALPVCYGVLRDLHILVRHLHSNHFAFCFDSELSYRKEMYSAYKANRENNPAKDSILKEIEQLREEILPMLGYQNIYKEQGAEADDLMAVLCQMRPDQQTYWLVSCDMDLYQLLDSNRVMIWNQATKSAVTETTVWNHRRIHPHEWKMFKALVGCKSDNIEGIQGIGEVTATNYIRGQSIPERSSMRIMTHWEDTVMRNTELVTLPYSKCKVSIPEPVMDDCPDTELWDTVVCKYGLDQLIRKCP